MSRSSKEYFDECQRELNRDPEYLAWLDMVEQKSRIENGGEDTTNSSEAA